MARTGDAGRREAEKRRPRLQEQAKQKISSLLSPGIQNQHTPIARYPKSAHSYNQVSKISTLL
jgi:hypothetical protein